MKRFILSLLLLASVSCAGHNPPNVTPQPVEAVVERIKASIVRITIEVPERGNYVCTGWSLGPRKFQTAAHCTTPLHEYPDAILRVNEINAFVLKEDVATDLATVVADLTLPELTFRDEPLQIGELVKATGFGYGFTKPLTTNHTVQLLEYTLEADIYPGTVFLYPFIGGMSGGPVYDRNGLVVGIVQRGTSTIGYGVSVKTIKHFLEPSDKTIWSIFKWW